MISISIVLPSYPQLRNAVFPIQMIMETVDEPVANNSFCMLDLWVADTGVDYAFMYNGVRFLISILAEKLRGEGGLFEEFNDFKEDLEDPEKMFEFEE